MRKFLIASFAIFCFSLFIGAVYSSMTDAELNRLFTIDQSYAYHPQNVHGEELFGENSGVGPYLNWMEGRSTSNGKWFFYIITQASNSITYADPGTDKPLIFRPINTDGYSKLRIMRYISHPKWQGNASYPIPSSNDNLSLASMYIGRPTSPSVDNTVFGTQFTGNYAGEANPRLYPVGTYLFVNASPIPSDKITDVTHGHIPRFRLLPLTSKTIIENSSAAPSSQLNNWDSGILPLTGSVMNNVVRDDLYAFSVAGTEEWELGAAQSIVIEASFNQAAADARITWGTELIWVNLSR